LDIIKNNVKMKQENERYKGQCSKPQKEEGKKSVLLLNDCGREAPLRPHSKHHGVPGLHKCKISCGVAKWDEVLAKELIAKASVCLHKRVSHVNIRDVVKVYLKRDAHMVLEGHMPSCVPLSFAERVIIQSYEPSIWSDVETFQMSIEQIQNIII
jgi:hypothetical protein